MRMDAILHHDLKGWLVQVTGLIRRFTSRAALSAEASCRG